MGIPAWAIIAAVFWKLAIDTVKVISTHKVKMKKLEIKEAKNSIK